VADKNLLQSLEKEKLEAEIQLLQNQVNRDSEENSRKQRLEKFKIVLPIILTGVSILAGLFGILFPSLQYIKQQKEEYKFQFNSDMMQFISDLGSDDSDKSEQAIMMLSFYERDAIPVLLFKLERVKFDDKGTVINALKNIEELSEKDNLVIERLFGNSERFFERGYREPFEKISNKTHGLLNYIYALGEFGDSTTVSAFLSTIYLEVESNTTLQQLTMKKILEEITLTQEKLGAPLSQ